jgi:hypothetical protein
VDSTRLRTAERARRALKLAAILLLAGVGLFALAQLVEKQRAERAEEQLARAAETLGATLKTTSEAAHLRAEALAALPVVRAAIETDVETVNDIERSSNVFLPAPGETIELRQRGQRVVLLLRAPASARALALDGPEVQLADDGDALAITVTAHVMPMYEAGHKGALAVRRRVSLDGVKHELDGLRAALIGLEKVPLLLAGEASARPEWTVSTKVPGQPSLTLEGARRSSGTGALGVISIVLVALSLGAAVSALWRPRAELPRLPLTVDTPVLPATAIQRLAGISRELPAVHGPSEPPLHGPPEPPRLAVMPEELDSLPILVPLVAEPLARTEAPTDRLIAGRYRVIHPIGNGHGSEVYLAQTVQQVGAPKVVALKLLHPQAHFGADLFLESLQHAARVVSAEVARIHDYGIDDQRFFVAMEYVEGCSLQRLVDELRMTGETMPVKQSLAIGIAVCRALEAAHEAQVGGLPAPVLHRDLRPSSVLIGRHGAVKVGDFGAAHPMLTAFTAPEVARGLRPDPRADVYSLGMVLGELLAGAAMPPSLEAVLAKATQASPRRRYASAALLRDDLQDVAAAVVEPPSSGVLGDWVERVRRSHA